MSLVETLSISVNVILIMAIIIVKIAMPSSAWLFTKKKLGFLKNKTLNFVAWDDRVLQLEAEDVAPEGMLESKGKSSLTKSFYLAKPQDETNNTQQNVKNSERDLDVLPLYNLDGITVGLSHISKAIVTNPKVITALRLANRVDVANPRELKADLALPKPLSIKGELTNAIEVLVKLPFDPVDIKRNFPLYWQQSNIDATKRRNREIGKEQSKSDGKSMFKLLLIIGVIALAILVIGGAVGGKLFG